MRKVSKKQEEINKIKKKETESMHTWFREIWDEREDEYGFCYCYETGKPMHRDQYRNITTVYDHVLEKNNNAYPQYKFTKRNIVIILPEVHDQKGINISKTPKIKEYRDRLLSLHDLGKLED